MTESRSAQVRSFRAGLAHQLRPTRTTGRSLLLLDVPPDDRTGSADSVLEGGVSDRFVGVSLERCRTPPAHWFS